jgi:hypothetical protein
MSREVATLLNLGDEATRLLMLDPNNCPLLWGGRGQSVVLPVGLSCWLLHLFAGRMNWEKC